MLSSAEARLVLVREGKVIGLHDLSVPVFARYIDRLDGIVARTAAHASERDLSEAQLLQSRLAPDMLPFEAQVRIAARFPLRALGPLIQRLLVVDFAEAATFAVLREDVAIVRAVLASIEPTDLDGREDEIVSDRAGLADIALPAARFVIDYALPNMLFHLSTAYAIARWEGVPLGKADFDGWHRY